MSEENKLRKWSIWNLAGISIQLVNKGYCQGFTKGARNGEAIVMQDNESSYYDAFKYSDRSLIRIGNYPFNVNVFASECGDLWKKINYSIVFSYKADKVSGCANVTSVNAPVKEIVCGSKVVEFTLDCSELAGEEEIDMAMTGVVNDVIRLLMNDRNGVFENIAGVNLVSVKEFKF